MNGIRALVNGCKVVAIEDNFFTDDEIKAGTTFVVRGPRPTPFCESCFEFVPDWDRYGKIDGLMGFECPSDEIDESFWAAFRVLAEDDVERGGN